MKLNYSVFIMPLFVVALNALYSFQFDLVRLWFNEANVRFFSFRRWKREENVSETVFLFGKYGYVCGEKGEKHYLHTTASKIRLPFTSIHCGLAVLLFLEKSKVTR